MIATTSPFMTDESITRHLIEQAHAGDRQACGALFSRFAGQLAVYVSLKMSPQLRAHMEVEDALQEVYLRLFERLKSFDPSRTPSLYAWIRSVAQNVLRELTRHHVGTQKRGMLARSLDRDCGDTSRASTIVLELSSDDPTPSRVTISRDRVRRVLDTLEQLPEKERDIVWELLFEGLSGREVAERHGVSPGTVSKCLARAMLRLGKEISLD